MVNFKAPYNREDALSFLDKFLPEDFQRFDEKIEVDFKPQFIHNIRKIGEAPSLENLHIYEITHESENDPRVSLSKDSFRLLAHFNVRKALIFFVSKTSPNYRFSLVTVDLKWESGARVKREYSNPRRYSFFLGPDARVHTPNDFLIKKDRAKDTVDLLSRFDVEIVTKDFFTKYKGLFDDVRGYLEKDHGFKIFAGKNNIDIDTFAKKLLGQIVFCYFLQRKGWLGAKRGESINKGDKDFMRSLFNRCAEGNNFYNDYLEHLFYGSLNNRAEGSGDFYRKHFDCQIPFLNGGLFEPPEDYDWEKSFVHIPDKIFSNKQNTGILDVFDLYNFTVYEDDPIDREVSVDPEMLGKVFENLLPENLRKGQGAYYTPREIVHYMCQESLINYLATETKVDIDKIRDLVVTKHFEGEGSRESIDRALQNIKVCDPACGSGAFLVGMLHEIVGARRILNPKKDEYHPKKETIQDSIYGVDIDPGAVEIAKLRLWLSLVVDYELKDIEPLPNLDYKIMCGNSLLEELIIGEESIGLFDERLLDISKASKAKSSLFKDEELKGKGASARNEYLQNQLKEKQKQLLELHSKNQLTPQKRKELEQEIDTLNKELNPRSKKRVVDYHPTLFGEKAEKYFNLLKELHKQYFTEYDPKKKQQKRRQIEDIEMEFIKSSIKEKVDGIEDRIRNLNMQDPADRKQQAVLMKKKLEYLAIPEQIHTSKVRPYFLWKLNFFEVFQEKGGFDVVIANPPYVRQEEIKEEKDRLRLVGYMVYEPRADLYVYFFEKGLNLLHQEGIFCYIAPNKFMKTRYGKNLRIYLHDRQIIDIIDFFELPIFDASTEPAIYLIKNQDSKLDTLYTPVRNLDNLNLQEMKSLQGIRIKKENLASDGWILEDRRKVNILEKMNSKGKSLADCGYQINYGIKTGLNNAFIIDTETKEKLCSEDPRSEKLIKPILQTQDIGKFYYKWNGAWIIIVKFGFYKELDHFPAIKKHLLKYEKQLRSRGQCKYSRAGEANRKKDYAGQHHWLELDNNPKDEYLELFEKEKIIYVHTAKSHNFVWDASDYYLNNSLYFITNADKGILAFLNSKLFNFYKRIMFVAYGDADSSGRCKLDYNKMIKVPLVDFKNQKALSKIVDEILSIASSKDYLSNLTKQAKVEEYERQIDQMVYKLYGLTEEEIKIVEGA